MISRKTNAKPSTPVVKRDVAFGKRTTTKPAADAKPSSTAKPSSKPAKPAPVAKRDEKPAKPAAGKPASFVTLAELAREIGMSPKVVRARARRDGGKHVKQNAEGEWRVPLADRSRVLAWLKKENV